jgi:hypothetical protein
MPNTGEARPTGTVLYVVVKSDGRLQPVTEANQEVEPTPDDRRRDPRTPTGFSISRKRFGRLQPALLAHTLVNYFIKNLQGSKEHARRVLRGPGAAMSRGYPTAPW